MLIETTNIPELLKTHRKKAGLTQSELGILAGISPMSIHRIEHGASPSVDLIARLINICLLRQDIDKRFKRKILISKKNKLGKE